MVFKIVMFFLFEMKRIRNQIVINLLGLVFIVLGCAINCINWILTLSLSGQTDVQCFLQKLVVNW